METVELRRTCAGCENLVKTEIEMAGVVWSCKGKTVVPHHTESDNPEDEWVTTFWRVPKWCPLPDEGVDKSDDLQPRKHWQTIRYAR